MKQLHGKHSTVLRAAKSLIDTPETWVKEVLACNYRNEPVFTNSEHACKFCSLGALDRITGNMSYLGIHDVYLRNACQYMFGHRSVATANDEHTHAEVMQMWDKAIELAEAAEAIEAARE